MIVLDEEEECLNYQCGGDGSQFMRAVDDSVDGGKFSLLLARCMCFKIPTTK